MLTSHMLLRSSAKQLVHSLFFKSSEPFLVPYREVPGSKSNKDILFHMCCNQSILYRSTQFSSQEREWLVSLYHGYKLEFNGPYWISMRIND